MLDSIVILSLLLAITAAAPSGSIKSRSFKAAVFLERKPQNLLARSHGIDAIEETGPHSLIWKMHANIGTPSQAFEIIPDTGSADTWVFGPELASQDNDEPVFHPDTSSSWRKSSDGFSTTYFGSHTVSGYTGTETVAFGDFKMPQAPLGVATTSQEPLSAGTQGVLGLARQKADGNVALSITLGLTVMAQTPAFIESIKKLVDQPVFTANFKVNGQGSMEFGNIDSAQHKGELSYTSVNQGSAPWVVENLYFIVGDNEQPVIAPQSVSFDTGTSNTWVDVVTARAWHSKIDGSIESVSGNQVTWKIPCKANPPNMRLRFGNIIDSTNNIVTIPGTLFVNNPIGTGSSMCYSALSAYTSPSTLFCGGAFFISQFVVFNTQTPSLGFAPQV